ncbi:MAG: PP2C family protein-serine/threonine phosphatase [Bacteroidota bacterium]
MTTFKVKIKKTFYLLTISIFLLVIFVIDVIRGHGSIDLEGGVISLIRDILVLAAFGCFYLLLENMWRRDQGPAKKLGFILVLMLVVVTASGLLSLSPSSGFDIKNDIFIPNAFDSIVFADIYGVVFGTTLLIVLLTLRDITFWKRRKSTRRNFLILVGCIIATALSTMAGKPANPPLITMIMLGITILVIVLNSFRLSWIVYLSKREKLFSMVYGFILFCIFIGFDILTTSGTVIGKSLLFYSPPLKSFIMSTSMFGTIYFGMTFLSTMFHLPTAEAYDRKISEVASLHNLSRLITQVFDFNELVESVTRMTLDVCQAQSAWLEIIKEDVKTSPLNRGVIALTNHTIETVALNNISREEINAIVSSDDNSLRTIVFAERKAVVIDDVLHDKRTKHVKELERKFGSIVIVPLVSHETIIGVLYATKSITMGFDKEDVDLISAFADQATIAIENSRLIEKSLERERLMREIMVAQEMQKKLLPQRVPILEELELEALSSPAFEVGGDYYDFTMLDEHHLGIIVGDVSGKGVSAAFYMAEMKGIFQSLSKIYPTPTEFLTHAHKALADTIDRRSFISVIYAVLDLRNGVMKVARAGHCPMLYLTNGTARYVKPVGMGLGMGSSEIFQRTIVQEIIRLQNGDGVIFFTDGITEARPEGGEEFGYDRLLDVCLSAGKRSAIDIRDTLISTIDKHMNHQPPEDDLTLIVIKWRKSPNNKINTNGETQ